MRFFVVFLGVFLACTPVCSPVYGAPVNGALAAVNVFRVRNGRRALILSPLLGRAAEGHGRDMAGNGFFAHQGSNGSSPNDRARGVGYRSCLLAENIAKGQKTLQGAMDSWITSRPHRKNLLLRKLREVAVVRVKGDIWVMVLAQPGC